MKKKLNPLNITEPMSIEEAINGIAAEFVEQYEPHEIDQIRNLDPDQFKAYLQQVCVSGLEFATGILPGRPSRPKKPNI